MIYHFMFLPVVLKGSNFSISSPKLVIFYFVVVVALVGAILI